MTAGANLLALADAGLGWLWESPAEGVTQPLRTQEEAIAALYNTAGARLWPVDVTDSIAASIGPSWPSGASYTAGLLTRSGLPGADSLAVAYLSAAGASQPDSRLDVLTDAGTASAQDLRDAGKVAGKAVSSGAVGAAAALLLTGLLALRK